MQSTNLSLSSLIANIESPKSLNELLVLYDRALQANNQFDISVITPILPSRMESIVSTYSTKIESGSLLASEIQYLSNHVLGFTSDLGSLLSVVLAGDFGDKIKNLTQSSSVIANKVSYSFESLLSKLMSQLSEKPTIDIEELRRELIKLGDMIAKDPGQAHSILGGLEDIQMKVKGYLSIDKDKGWREEFAIDFEKLEKVQFKVEELVKAIQIMKSQNPLIGDELLELALRLEEKLAKLLNLFNENINKVYRDEMVSEEVVRAISCYLSLSNKVTSKS